MKNKIQILFLIICLFFFSSKSYSQTSILIDGNNRIAINTILDLINFDKNENKISNEDLNQMQKKLFESNFFENVKISYKNNILTINVIENPLINFFYINGVENKTREEFIYKNIILGQNKIFSKNLLNQDIKKIKDIFLNEGYFNVSVVPKVSILESNNVNLVYDIQRGKKFNIFEIFFIGDKYFSSSTLSDVISSSTHGWWKFLSSSSTVNQSRIDYDNYLLKEFYLNQGFYDVQILSSDIKILSTNSASLTFSINSGKKYIFSDSQLLDSFKELSEENFNKIDKLIKKRLKNNYSKKKIRQLSNDIYSYFSLKKIEFLDFDIKTTKTSKNNSINTKVEIVKKPRKFVNTISVKGNSITEEKVIRRELLFAEGDNYSDTRLKKSIDNLKSLGIFKEVNSKILNIDQELVNINLSVEEQPTGAISAGVGVGTNGSTVSTGISEKNLFGMGINANGAISLGTEKVSGNMKVDIPDFKNSGNILSNDIFAISTDFENSGYKSKLIGDNVSIKYEFLEDISMKLGVGVDRDEVDTNDDASQLLKSREGSYMTYKAFYNLETDKRNSKFFTTDGYTTGFSQTIAVPGSDIPYLSNNIYSSVYFPVSKDYTFSVKSALNSINSLNGKDIKLSDRKFVSNKKLRGFENFGVGPKDGTSHVGGNYSAYLSIGSTTPNPLPDKWNANSVVFLDFGNVWGVDYNSSIDSNKIRSSAGVGLEWVSPIGPISFTFSQVLSSANTDIEENFSFQLGSTF